MQDYVQTTIKPGIVHHHLPRHDFLGVTYSLCTCEYSMVEFVYVTIALMPGTVPYRIFSQLKNFNCHCKHGTHSINQEVIMLQYNWWAWLHKFPSRKPGSRLTITFIKRSQTIVIWQYFNLQCMALAQNLAITVL